MTAMAWSVEGKTDGRIPKAIPATLTRAPQGKKLTDALKELTDGKLWKAIDAAYEIHDFLQWNLSAADIASRSEAKSRAGASGGRRSAEARQKHQPSTSEAPASAVLQVAAKTSEAEGKPKSLSKSQTKSEEPAPEGVVVLVEDPDRETMCPMDLCERAEKLDVFSSIASSLQVATEDLRKEAGQFVAYWTVGGGAGQRRRQWMAKLRQRLVTRVKEGAIAPAVAPVDAAAEARAKERLAREAERQQREIDAQTAEARASLLAKGIDPDKAPPFDLAALTARIG
jgi:hypothetical protein